MCIFIQSTRNLSIEKGYKEETLYSKINRAADENKITESMKLWSNKIRLDSNAIRHANENCVNLTMDDAKGTIEFAVALADFLFVIPYKVNKTISNK
jgi:Domain of unknown function (DUF4145)